jgi:hypothetical protein
MAIDTTNTLQLEQIEGLPEGLSEGIKQIIGPTRLDLYVANLDSQKPEVEKVCKTSEILEERTFSKKDILKLIALFAMANKLEMNDLKVSKIINNEQGVMLALEVKSPNHDGGYQQISYMIKGIANEGQLSRTTAIDRSFWDKDDMPEGGGIIAEYLEGKWRFNS